MSYTLLQTLTNNQANAISESSAAGNSSLIGVQAIYTDLTPVAQTFDSGVKEVTSITCPAATSINSGQYFLINSPSTSYYVWFNKDAAGGDPLVSGKTGVAVAILAADTAAGVATKLAAALDSLTDFVAPVPGANIVTNTNNNFGSVTDASNVNVGGTFDISVTTQGVTAEISPTSDLITIPTHGLITGVLGQLTTTGTLPTGLSLSTNYFVIKIDDNNIKLATTYANALAKTAIDITGDGTGVHTFTPTTINATLKLQSSIDGINWFDIAGKSVTITGTGSTIFSLIDFTESLFRTNLIQTSGQGILNLITHTHKRI